MTAHLTFPCSLLQLTALDRVRVLPDAVEARMNGYFEDWRYFLDYLPDGRLLLATPFGSESHVQWQQVESIEKRSPICVRAKSKRLWERPTAQMAPEDWTNAVVLGARLDLRSRLDGFRLRLDNGDTWRTANKMIIHPEDFDALAKKTHRGVMPCCGPYTRRGVLAAGQAEVAERRAKQQFTRFLAAALLGNATRTDHDVAA